MVAECGCQMRFAQPNTTKKNDIAFFINELESEQVFYLELVDFFGPGPLELFKRFNLRKTCGTDASLRSAVLSQVGFCSGQFS